jgi:hypothetical protein
MSIETILALAEMTFVEPVMWIFVLALVLEITFFFWTILKQKPWKWITLTIMEAVSIVACVAFVNQLYQNFDHVDSLGGLFFGSLAAQVLCGLFLVTLLVWVFLSIALKPCWWKYVFILAAEACLLFLLFILPTIGVIGSRAIDDLKVILIVGIIPVTLITSFILATVTAVGRCRAKRTNTATDISE